MQWIKAIKDNRPADDVFVVFRTVDMVENGETSEAGPAGQIDEWFDPMTGDMTVVEFAKL